MNRNFLLFPLLVLIGILIGGLTVYSYSSFNDQESEKEDFACRVESLSKEEIDMRAASAYLKFRDIKNNFIPKGVPEVYGNELNISFDEVQDAIDKVKIYGPTFGNERISLADNDLNRYIDIGLLISCEYCCNVEAIVREDGSAACGCAHSQMMRGLSAYLIKNHPEMSNDEILNELEMWKRTYFPKQTLSKELKRLEDSGESGIEEILREFPDFLPQMVGGC